MIDLVLPHNIFASTLPSSLVRDTFESPCFKAGCCVSKMNRLVTKSTSTASLELARQRLRSRFHSKFLSQMQGPSMSEECQSLPFSQMQEPPLSAEQAAKLHSLPTVDTKPHLEAARQRIRNRFREKFKAAPTEATSYSFDQPMTSDDNVITSKLHLEEARARLRTRFEKKFQPDFEDFPLTLDQAVQAIDSDWGRTHAAVITDGSTSYTILKVSKAWEDLCGYSQAEAFGHTFQSLNLQGSFTKPHAIDGIRKALSRGDRASFHLVNGSQSGRLFRNYLRVAPLSQNGNITHFVGVLEAEEDFDQNSNQMTM